MTVDDEFLDQLLKWFKRDGENALKAFFLFRVPKRIILKKYEYMIQIECLPEEEKKELWNYACQLVPAGTKEQRIAMCKIIYTIGSMI